MADRDPKTGHFVKGNKMPRKAGLPPGLLKKIRQKRPEFYKAFIDFGSLTLEQTNKLAANPQALTNMQATALKFWVNMRQEPNVAMYSMAFQIYCIKMDVVQSMVDEHDEEVQQEIKQLPITREQKLEMLDIAKKIVEDEK